MRASPPGWSWRPSELDLDAVPGCIADEGFDWNEVPQVRPACRQQSFPNTSEDFGFEPSENDRHVALDIFGASADRFWGKPERPPARQTPCGSKPQEGFGPLGELLSMSTEDAFGKTMTWTKKVPLGSIQEKDEDCFQQFHFGNFFDDEDCFDEEPEVDFRIALEGPAYAGQMGESEFPDRNEALSCVDARDAFDRSSWAWTRPQQVPDPYGTSSSASSAELESIEVHDEPMLAVSFQADAESLRRGFERGASKDSLRGAVESSELLRSCAAAVDGTWTVASLSSTAQHRLPGPQGVDNPWRKWVA